MVGKGQVGAAQDVLHNQLGLDIPVAGLVKTINIKPVSYCLAMICSRFSSNEIQSNSFCCKESKMKFIGFAITFHRQLRSKNSFSSRLDEIPGLGPKRKQQLMKTFKSLKNIQAASVAEIQQAGIPQAVAETILEKLSDQRKPRPRNTRTWFLLE